MNDRAMEKTEGGLLVSRRTFMKLVGGSVAIAAAAPQLMIVDKLPPRLINIYLENLPLGWWLELYAHNARIDQTEPLFTGTIQRKYVKSQAMTGSLVILKMTVNKQSPQWLTGAIQPDLYDSTRIDAQEFFGWKGPFKRALPNHEGNLNGGGIIKLS